MPLQRIERLPFPRLLIADDTGLGKTAEAGLILSRLLQRRRADRILILCRARPEPERWQEEMKTKFGLDIEVVNDADDYARLRRRVPSHLNVFGACRGWPCRCSSPRPASAGHTSSTTSPAYAGTWRSSTRPITSLAVRGDPHKRLAELGRLVSETSAGATRSSRAPGGAEDGASPPEGAGSTRSEG